MNGLIGRKIGMTSIFDAAGKNIACTVIEASPNIVTQVKTVESDGYDALQLAYGEAKQKNVTQPLSGHFSNANTTPKQKVVEFRNYPAAKAIGEAIELTEVFSEGDTVHAIGTSKGKGFQGVVKRHKFSGVGQSTHGQHNRLRAPGSVGASAWPSRVFKGVRMAGRMGNERVKTKNLKIVKLLPEKNLILIQGSVPGFKGSFVIIEK
ncbi:MAG: 50S ribosomal protein L3 [Saprospiraceae bacterium]|nr:50S ribosomal protein L3 [Saprospiraceae bacterium]MBK6565473.1 50S ribosomal protein L3 [Saprospiraceae bacterium]MBK7522743.1 50S ribosomal protein L3 [Saprospiraceae bacterium]MBK8370920.1 50S ribosomal protein L3 [Saprospiraceae bacterium]MBK8546220.1 50S ribosomal protein L3 [Saprospiraceae bacterium]